MDGQRQASIHRHALVRRAEGSIPVQRQGEDLADLWVDVAGWM
ncbi:hypothetical protein ACWGDX_36600 [Streptomyces sp. NPDC055025]